MANDCQVISVSKSSSKAGFLSPMTGLAHTPCHLLRLEREKLVGAKKCLGASTSVDRDIGDCLRCVKEIEGIRVWLGVKKSPSSHKPGPWSRSFINIYLI